MSMITEYHDPTHVKCINDAVMRSASFGRAYAVWVIDGGEAKYAPLSEAPVQGIRWVLNGYVCEEQVDGKKTRQCVLIASGFRCIWEDA